MSVIIENNIVEAFQKASPEQREKFLKYIGDILLTASLPSKDIQEEGDTEIAIRW